MTYPETLAYLYAQLPMFQRVGKAAYKADLSNTLAMMEILGHPEQQLRCIHVAGTNGKGSTSHLIASVLQENGSVVGLHTSPHLKDMRERFRVNGEMPPEQAIVDFVAEYRRPFERIGPSFFEWGVAFALWWFREQQVDIAVLETGMGGRLDSTNVVVPDIAVITNVGWDHMDFLGNSLEAIATEKAGIIKPGSIVVIGESNPALLEVFLRKCAEVDAFPIVVDHSEPLPFPTPLAGAHQERNARTALAACREMNELGWHIPDEDIARGFANVVANTGLRGRWEMLSQDPLTIADVAHNADGIRAAKALLAIVPHRQLHIVLGTVNDKDLGRVLAELPKEARYHFCKADIPRGLDANALREQAAAMGLQGEVYPTVGKALRAARQAAGPEDLVLVTGSVFVVAEVL